MDLSELLGRLARTLDELSVPYLVTGSVATITYGELRFTNDIDVVVRLTQLVKPLRSAFPDAEFYLSPDAVREAMDRRSQFNIVYPRTGLKVDVMSPVFQARQRDGLDRWKRRFLSP